jgi:hypothetical protein
MNGTNIKRWTSTANALLLIGLSVFVAGQCIVSASAGTIVAAKPVPAQPNHPPGWDPAKQGAFTSCGAIDARGRIWIGAEDRGLAMLDPGEGDAAKWRTFTRKDGLGDDTAYALAVDSRGRVWVGHVRSGVSVFDGTTWKNYGALDGPLGHRVYRIAVCSATAARGAGDVWIATDLGLSRYSDSTHTWTYILPTHGLPADPCCMAFDHFGDIYVGTQCHGIAMAQADEDYKSWRTITGPEQQPAVSNGAGLPGNLINDLLVTHDGTIFAATTRGLARSDDRGATWSFRRGENWIAKREGSIDGPPEDWAPDDGPTLLSDYVTCLAEDSAGRLWVGYRSKGYQCLDEKTLNVIAEGDAEHADYCALILPRREQTLLVGTRGFGLQEATGSALGDVPAAKHEAAAAHASLPTAATAPSAADLQRLTKGVQALPVDALAAPAYLSQDWDTEGDWVGRYGRQAAFWPWYGSLVLAPSAYELTGFTGPHHKNESGRPWTYFADMNAQSRNVPYAPGRARRIRGEWNDGGWQGNKFGQTFEGPDLWFRVAVSNRTRVSVYIYNIGNNNSDDRWRDYVIEVKDFCDDLNAAQHAPVLAASRVPPAQNGAYRTFLLSDGQYWIRVASNYSHMVGVTAIYFDRAEAMQTAGDDVTSRYLSGVPYDPPAAPALDPAAPPALRAARDLWDALDNSSAADVQMPYRLLAYRAAAANGASPQLLANWRWTLHLWTTEDRAEWENVMARSREALKNKQSEMKPDERQ